MPDRSAFDYAHTLEGEHSMRADKLRREARELRRQADELEQRAAWEDERTAWARELANALEGAISSAP